MAVKTWVWVTLGIVVLAIVGLLAAGATIAYFAVRDIEITTTSPDEAERTVSDLRQQFAGQRPLLEVPDGNIDRARINRPGPDAERQDVRTLHVLAYDPDEDKVVRLSLPLWMLRLGTGSFRVSTDGGFDIQRLRLTVEDVERHGPGLILDFAAPSGEQVLVWSR